MSIASLDVATSLVAADVDPDSPALVGRDGWRLTHGELAAAVASARAGLDALGGRQLVHLRARADLDFVVAWLACFEGGHPVLLTDRPGLAAAYGASCARVDGAWTPTGAAAPDLHPDLRLLLSTSGSTGSPRLVRLSATNLTSNAAAIAAYLDLRADDVALTTLPLDYCYGLSVLHSHLGAGASVVLDDRSVTDPGLWTTAREHGVTGIAGVPHTFDLLAAAGWPDVPTLRRVTQAGGRMAPEKVRDLARRGQREGWDFVVMYGQTEATARMAYLPPHLALSRPTSVGVAVPGGHLRLEPVTGAPAGAGELVYSGPNVMLGYATAPTDLARGAELSELRTGDLARIDADGLVEIVGRRSRFAKLLGQRIDLDRVESLLRLAGHEVAAAESADGRALVVAVPAAVDDVAVAEEVLALVTEQSGLPAHCVRLALVDDLPRTRSGKPDHGAVARLAATSHDADDDHGRLEARLAALYARVLRRDDVPVSASFVDLGGDSLSYVELALQLERRLGTLPGDWPQRSLTELAELAGRRPRRARPLRRRGRVARLETGIVLRAVAMVLIVGSHTDLWVLLGGAHVLLAVAGANLARFQLVPGDDARERLARVGRAARCVAVPSVLWLAAVALVTRDLPWQTVVLLNDLLGPHRWTEPAWHYWFVEVIVLLTVVVGVLSALPVVRTLDAEGRFALAAGLTAAALLPRFVAAANDYDGDVIHSGLFVAWLFLGGWAAQEARRSDQRIVVSTLLLAGTYGFTGDTERDLLIAGGLMLLVWCRSLPCPSALVAPIGALASASLWIYLTHWQVYPWFEDRMPVAGLALSLAVGVAAARVLPAAGRTVAGAAVRATRRATRRAVVTVCAPHPRTPNPSLPS